MNYTIQLNMYKQLLPLIVVLCCNLIMAQQDPQFTQYNYNMSVINPAYATRDLGTLNLGGNYRRQWTGTVGSPRTFSFFGHTPFSNTIELGLTFTSDQIGEDVIEINEKNINADFAYVLNITDHAKLSLGLKAGVTLYDTAFSGILINSNDPAFSNDANQAFPSIGAGAYFFSDHYYIGISAPNFLRATQLDDAIAFNSQGREEIHFYLIGGYVIPISAAVKLKPSFLVREVNGAPLNVDLSLNTLLYDRFEIGASYRHNDAISGIVGFRIAPSLKVAYAYDATVSDFSSYNDGSHEIVLLFDLSLFGLKEGYKKSPRFF